MLKDIITYSCRRLNKSSLTSGNVMHKITILKFHKDRPRVRSFYTKRDAGKLNIIKDCYSMYNIMAGKYRIQNAVIKRLDPAFDAEEIYTITKKNRHQQTKD